MSAADVQTRFSLHHSIARASRLDSPICIVDRGSTPDYYAICRRRRMTLLDRRCMSHLVGLIRKLKNTIGFKEGRLGRRGLCVEFHWTSFETHANCACKVRSSLHFLSSACWGRGSQTRKDCSLGSWSLVRPEGGPDLASQNDTPPTYSFERR